MQKRRVGLYLNQHIGVNERADLDHHRGGWALYQEFSVRQANLFPAGDVADVPLG
jgi:hypothetical protein